MGVRARTARRSADMLRRRVRACFGLLAVSLEIEIEIEIGIGIGIGIEIAPLIAVPSVVSRRSR
jgi:hypothetical protein